MNGSVTGAWLQNNHPISLSRIEKFASAGVDNASSGPCSTIDDHVSPVGPV
jgi:hypothetical protein